jgi:hypothetical protein
MFLYSLKIEFEDLHSIKILHVVAVFNLVLFFPAFKLFLVGTRWSDTFEGYAEN